MCSGCSDDFSQCQYLQLCCLVIANILLWDRASKDCRSGACHGCSLEITRYSVLMTRPGDKCGGSLFCAISWRAVRMSNPSLHSSHSLACQSAERARWIETRNPSPSSSSWITGYLLYLFSLCFFACVPFMEWDCVMNRK